MNIGNSFHSYNLNQITQLQQPPAKPEEKTSTTVGHQPEQSTQTQTNPTIDSLGKGHLP
ncbi:hypothetical protein [Pseudomonas sp. L1(2025)]|uniref:hypothetical protein n=1 Tax=Pseudomonas sp. L1(2025) TaxID=3449429 RepID=UPI003F690727